MEVLIIPNYTDMIYGGHEHSNVLFFLRKFKKTKKKKIKKKHIYFGNNKLTHRLR